MPGRNEADSPVNANANSSMAESKGRWDKTEHDLFLKGLNDHGKDWKKISDVVGTRTVVQIRTHAQKYFNKLKNKYEQKGLEVPDTLLSTASKDVKATPEMLREVITNTSFTVDMYSTNGTTSSEATSTKTRSSLRRSSRAIKSEPYNDDEESSRKRLKKQSTQESDATVSSIDSFQTIFGEDQFDVAQDDVNLMLQHLESPAPFPLVHSSSLTEMLKHEKPDTNERWICGSFYNSNSTESMFLNEEDESDGQLRIPKDDAIFGDLWYMPTTSTAGSSMSLSDDDAMALESL